ncbi:hypothetical protein HVZ60_04200 [Escherichia coli]|nr:hypothetical protein [Escherichia coli]
MAAVSHHNRRNVIEGEGIERYELTITRNQSYSQAGGKNGQNRCRNVDPISDIGYADFSKGTVKYRGGSFCVVPSIPRTMDTRRGSNSPLNLRKEAALSASRVSR